MPIRVERNESFHWLMPEQLKSIVEEQLIGKEFPSLRDVPQVLHTKGGYFLEGFKPKYLNGFIIQELPTIIEEIDLMATYGENVHKTETYCVGTAKLVK